jgi:hypothetical protein
LKRTRRAVLLHNDQGIDTDDTPPAKDCRAAASMMAGQAARRFFLAGLSRRRHPFVEDHDPQEE